MVTEGFAFAGDACVESGGGGEGGFEAEVDEPGDYICYYGEHFVWSVRTEEIEDLGVEWVVVVKGGEWAGFDEGCT